MRRSEFLRSQRGHAFVGAARITPSLVTVAAGRSALGLLALLLLTGSSRAQAPVKSLRVATRVIPPFVFEENGKLTGFSIDLWQGIS